MSNMLTAMLNKLPKNSIYIFDRYRTPNHLRRTFQRHRKRVAFKLGNPRLLQITFHTLGHWKATTEYAKSGLLLHVKELLGHKSSVTTEVYTHLINFESNEYTVMRPRTSKQEDDLIEAGFEYVRYDEKDQCPIYRKRK